MTRDVRETPAGKSLSVYVILDKKGRQVANVLAHFSDGGSCLVNVRNMGDDVCARTVKALGFTLDDAGRIATAPKGAGKRERDAVGEWPYVVASNQDARAGGYGYDKLTSALAGLVVDGHVLTNHCDTTGAPKPPKGRRTFPSDAKPPKGYSFANYQRAGSGFGRDLPEGEAGFMDCYRDSGLKYLESLGYRVIQPI